MKKLSTLLAGLALAALPCTSALASSFGFSFSGPTFTGSGTATYVPTSTANQFLVTTGTGSLTYGGNTYALSLLPIDNNPGNTGFAGNDNLFFAPPSGPFDFNGVAFSLVGTNQGLNLYTAPQGGVMTDFELVGIITGAQIGTDMAPINITLNPTGVTPEPGSLALLGTGALGAFGILRRKLAA